MTQRHGKETKAALAESRLSKEELRTYVERMLTVTFRTSAYQDSSPYGASFV